MHMWGNYYGEVNNAPSLLYLGGGGGGWLVINNYGLSIMEVLIFTPVLLICNHPPEHHKDQGPFHSPNKTHP